MKTILSIVGCVLLAVLIMPAFIKPPARDEAQEQAVVLHVYKLLQAFEAYRDEFGAFPAGTPAGIIRELRGENAKQAVFFDSPPESLNASGELLDPWGSPYRITFDSATGEPLIHSAGINRFFEPADSQHGDDYRSWKTVE